MTPITTTATSALTATRQHILMRINGKQNDKSIFKAIFEVEKFTKEKKNHPTKIQISDYTIMHNNIF